MLKILLCDDDRAFLSLENGIINRIIESDGLTAEVAAAASSAEEVYSFIRNNPDEYLIFLDIDFGRGMPGGIDVSSVLKQRCKRTRIVFTTNHHEMAMEVLKSGTEPFGFIEKGTDSGPLFAALRRYIYMAIREDQRSNDVGDVITLNVGGETVDLRVSDVLFVEAEKNVSHGVTYRTSNGSRVTTTGSLDRECEKLGNGFLRVHRSYIASKNHMLSIKNGYITMTDRSEIPCSVKMQREVKRLLCKK